MVEEIDNGRRVINQPAGHLEPGETLFEAALRETLEETGWVVELLNFVGVYQYYSAHNDTLYLRVAFTAGPLEQTGIAIDPDISAALWLSIQEIASLEPRSPLVLACIHDAMQQPPLPLSLVRQFV